MNTTKHNLVFYGLLLLSLIVQALGQNCYLDSVCSALGYQKLTSIGCSGPSDFTYISCPWRSSTSSVSQITWMFSPNTTVVPRVLDINSNPKLSLDRFTLEISNISSEQEGIYYCKVQFRDGSESSALGAGCAFVAGRAQFKTCPDEPANKECRGITHLEGEEHGSVEFDARLEYNYGGDCGMKQSVRQMFLNRIDDSGNSESLFICSNLGSLSGRKCVNRSHVSISFQGEEKYDLKLSLHSLNMSSSGRYQLQVNLNENEGRRSTIYKEFSVTVRAATPPPPAPATTERPTGTECPEDADPLLLLNGEVIARESNLTFESIKEGGEALLCVVQNKQCCGTEGTVTAEFRYPNGTLVTEDENCTNGVYATKGKQIVRLNRVGRSPQGGPYCCSVPASDGRYKNSCVDIQ